MTFSKKLKELLNSGKTIIVPDAYNPLSAKIIENMGFDVIQCSGYSYSIALCLKQESDVFFEQNLQITKLIIDSVAVPVMADGEDGFGDVEQIPLTMEKYLKIGTSGINLEDQILRENKKEKVIDCKDMVLKIKAARKTANDFGNCDFIINGRTDCLITYEDRKEGLIEAAKRANLYLEAGADMAFVTNVKTLDEVKFLVKEIDGKLSIAAGLPYNINNFSINELIDLGVTRISLPSILINASMKAMITSLALIKNGNFNDLIDNKLLCNNQEFSSNIKSFTNVNKELSLNKKL